MLWVKTAISELNKSVFQCTIFFSDPSKRGTIVHRESHFTMIMLYWLLLFNLTDNLWSSPDIRAKPFYLKMFSKIPVLGSDPLTVIEKKRRAMKQLKYKVMTLLKDLKVTISNRSCYLFHDIKTPLVKNNHWKCLHLRDSVTLLAGLLHLFLLDVTNVNLLFYHLPSASL